jgi:hypothetical protein
MKRRWFQFHLSTALLFMLTFGGILGANVRTSHGLIFPSQIGDAFGWPFEFTAQVNRGLPHAPWRFLPVNLAADVVIWLVLLFLIVIWELIARRRETGKPGSPPAREAGERQ